MKRLGLLFGLVGMGSLAMATPVDDFRNASRFVLGIGDNLPSPYTQQDMTVELRVFFGFLPISQNTTNGADEQVILKTPGSVNFVFNTGAIDPTLPNFPVNMVGTVSGQQVTYNFNQNFSQPGGYPINTTIDVNGTPTPVNLTINNVNVTGQLRSVFSSVSAFWNPVLGANSVVRGTHSGGDTNNFINVTTNTITGTIGGVTPSLIEVRFRRVQHIEHVGYLPNLTGTVNLNDVNNQSGRPVAWTLYPVAGTTSVASGTVTAGAVSLSPNVPVGNYRLLVKGPTHLAKLIPVSVGTSTTIGTVALVNGDVNGDNEVGAADFSALAAAYDAVLGDPGFSASADLNKDDEVGAADFSILAASYDETGDAP